MLKKLSFKNTSGFTLIELLIVIVILGVLASVALVNFQGSQVKARDVERKSNVKQIAGALEAYYNDHGAYPLANADKIRSCTTADDCSAIANCEWQGDSQRELCDSNNTVYMQIVPSDPTHTYEFCYESDAGANFRIYGALENNNDPEKKTFATGHCGQAASVYNFGISSGNKSLYDL